MASQDQSLFSAKYLHEKLNIPYKYLTRLMTDLVRQRCLISIRGRQGGFYFHKKLNEITLYRIIEIVEGVDTFSACILGFEECSEENPCVLHFAWEKNKTRFLETLKKTTLEEVAHTHIKKL